MNTTDILAEPMAIKVWTENRIIYLELADQRIIGFPANRFKILKEDPDELLKK